MSDLIVFNRKRTKKTVNTLVFTGFLLIISFFISPSVYAMDIADWTALTPGTSTGIRFSTTNATSVAYGGGKFVAVGASGKASYSTDGINWTELPAGASTGIRFSTTNATSVAYGGGKFVVVGASGKASYSTDGINWTVLTPGAASGIRFSTTQANSVTYGGGKFVVVGASGKASYSTDGINWTVLTPGDATGIKFGSRTAYSVTYGDGKFVVVGATDAVSATNTKTSYSTDGINWTSSSIIFSSQEDALSVIYGGDKFVAVGAGGVAASSTDGASWTARSVNFGTSDVLSVAYGDSTYIAVGASGKASYSSNGTSWTALPVSTHDGIWFGTSNVNAVVYGGDKFVAVGASGKASYTSVTDPVGPTVSLPVVSSVGTDTATFTGELTSLGESASVDVYFEWWTTASTSVVQSTTPQTMTAVGSFSVDMTGLVPETAYQFRAVVKYTNVDGERTVHSTMVDFTMEMVVDSEGWVALAAGDSTGIKFGTSQANGVTYGGGKFIAVGLSGKASYSTDGINWTALAPGTDTGIKFSTTTANAVAYGNGTFVVVGQSGKASYSTDGINWTALAPGTDTGIKFSTTTANAVTYGDGKFVVVGDSGKASYSTDGINWTALPVSSDAEGIKFGTTNNSAYGITYGSGQFVVVGMYRKISYSADGINWTLATSSGTSNALRSVIYDNGLFLAVGQSAGAMYSSDAISWTTLPTGTDAGIKFGSTQANSVVYGNSTFIVVGVSGKASYSTDGINWTVLTPGNGTGIRMGTATANAVAYGNGTFVVVGQSGKASYKVTDAPVFAPPTITTNAATTVASTTATLNGELTSLGDATSGNVHFEYGIGDFAHTTTPETLAVAGTFHFDVSGLTAGTLYQFRAVVEYENGGTQTVNGSTLTFTTDAAPTVPDAPTSFTATTQNTSEIALSWNAPLQDGGSAITGYQIERSADGLGGWSQIGTTNSVTTVYNDTGLISNTEYFYRVMAVNAEGSSSPSGVDSAITDAEVPTVGTDLATSVTDVTATLNSTIDLKDYGSINAHFEYGIGGFVGTTTPQAVNTSGTFSAGITGLTASSLYQFRVVIEYENGGTQTVYGDTETFTTDATSDPVTEPDAPTSLTATVVGTTQINLSWTAPVDDGGASITEYRVERSPDGVGSWTQIATTTSGVTTYGNTGLSASTEYFYRVKAVNSEGASVASNVESAITNAEDISSNPDSEESEPETLRVYNVSSEAGTDWIKITWKTNRNADSRVRYGADQNLKNEKEENGNRERHSITLRNLNSGTLYYFRVSSEDSNGDEDKSRVYSVTTSTYQAPSSGSLATATLLPAPSLPHYEDVNVQTTETQQQNTEEEKEAQQTEVEPQKFTTVASQLFETNAYKKEEQQYISEIKFQIVDDAGQPIAHLPVTLHSEPRTGITNEVGVVTFNDVPTGNHHLIFAYADKEVKKKVAIAEVQDVNAPLRAEVIVVSVVSDPIPSWVWMSFAGSAFVILYLVYLLRRQKQVGV